MLDEPVAHPVDLADATLAAEPDDHHRETDDQDAQQHVDEHGAGPRGRAGLAGNSDVPADTAAGYVGTAMPTATITNALALAHPVDDLRRRGVTGPRTLEGQPQAAGQLGEAEEEVEPGDAVVDRAAVGHLGVEHERAEQRGHPDREPEPGDEQHAVAHRPPPCRTTNREMNTIGEITVARASG